jgi:uncharacterized membrane protein
LTDPAFDAPALGFLGLGTEAPTTNDYVPLFPWLAPILVGIALGRPLARGAFGRAGAWHASNPLSRALVWAGRWSLPIYLTHQLVLFGGLYALREAIGPNPVALCVQECVRRSGDSARCRVSCTCVVGALRERGALGRIMTGPPSEPDRAILDDARQMCARAP